MIPQIISLNKVYDPGCHCAFTDIIMWRGRVWLTFREAVNHSVHPSSQIIIMASADHGRTFQVMARLAKRDTDVRDPKFYVQDDRLYVSLGCWEIPQDKDHRLSLLARTDNGFDWEWIDVPLFDNVTMWRARKGPDNAWYAAAYDRREAEDAGTVRLFKTGNGIDWEDVSVIYDAEFPNETELCFMPDGELIALVRREKSEGRKPILCRSAAPYTEWSRVECNRFFQGPLLERMSDGTLIAIGRSPRAIEEGEKCARKIMRMFTLDIETGELEPVLAFESGNDCTYASYLELPEGSASGNNGDADALLSYYSGHEYDNGAYCGGEQRQRAAIYVARMIKP